MSRNSDTAADKARDKALRDADRESRIVAFLSSMPEDMTPNEMECTIIAIVSAHMPDEMHEDMLPSFFLHLGLKLKGMNLSDEFEETTH